MSRIISFILALSLINILSLYSQDITSEQVLQKLKEHQAQIQTLSAAMNLTISGAGGPGMKQEGAYYYKLPDKSRMEINKPVSQIVIKNGSENYMKMGKNQSF